MLVEYLNRPVIVKLVTGESLPHDARFYGFSSIHSDMLWFVVPRSSNPLENEKEYHIPISSIATMELLK